MRKNLKGYFSIADIPYTKDSSLYYELLVKTKGKQFADRCWQQRLDYDKKYNYNDPWYDLFKSVKNYKPRDPLCLIGDWNWGYNTIKERLK